MLDIAALIFGGHGLAAPQQRVPAESRNDQHLNCRSWRRAAP
ncbi:hypothetical protein ACVOMV_15845 [Mesorhizobium atlanticum]